MYRYALNLSGCGALTVDLLEDPDELREAMAQGLVIEAHKVELKPSDGTSRRYWRDPETLLISTRHIAAAKRLPDSA